MPEHVYITGFGYTGQRLARRLGKRAHVLARRSEQVGAARNEGLSATRVDLDDMATLESLDLRAAALVHLAPPPRAGFTDTRLENLLAAIDSKVPAHIVLISTTGVYGDQGGREVAESTALDPQTDRAKRRVNAEEQVREFAHRHSCQNIILRVPGIYGPGRLPLGKLKEGQPLPPAEECGFSNRIHVDDLVSAIVAALDTQITNAVFNVSDGQPLNMREYRERVAAAAGLPPPPVISMAQAKEELSPQVLSFLFESRRINSDAIREQLGVHFEYEDPDAGIRASLAASSAG